MNNKYSKENVQIGDRVLVSGCGEEHTEKHWGTVNEHYLDEGTHVLMDDGMLLCARDYTAESGVRCYYAWWSEVHDRIPADKLAMHEGKPIDVRDHGQLTNPLQKVIEDLTATHRYLEQVTGKKYVAQLKGFDLESGNGYDSNEVTIKFKMEEK